MRRIWASVLVALALAGLADPAGARASAGDPGRTAFPDDTTVGMRTISGFGDLFLVKPGDAVTVTMIPAKNGQAVARIHQLIIPSGESIGSDRP